MALLSVAVLSLRCEPGLVDCVRTLLDQDPQPEVVVVNSGGGDPRAVLAAAGLHDVPVVHREERLTPGAVRNLGIEATRGDYVAFQAADAMAEPGWVAGRLAAHDAGAAAVSSLLTNPYPHSRSACAAALLLHHRRMAHTDPRERLELGLSFRRDVLERLGPFREDLRTGEDSEYKWRLRQAGEQVAFAPGVVTAHRYTRTPSALLRDQFARGVRQARARSSLGLTASRRRIPADRVIDAARALRDTSREQDPQRRRALRRGWPLIAPAALAYAAGAAVANRADRSEGAP